jgi:hypothetical protein
MQATQVCLDMPDKQSRFSLWVALILIAGMPRILGAFFLPNAFGDAYVYVRDAATYAGKIAAGTLALTDLYGFWLPLYQLICAVVIAVAGNPYYVAKLVSAMFGVGICLLVYDISLCLTSNRKAAFFAFLLIALSPLHIFNSASSMTDIPSAFFVLASLFFALKKRWIVAAVFAALAGLTRVDNWMLLVLLPAVHFFEERRVSLVSIAIILFPPLFWFYISWKATGDWLACFVVRKQYMDALLAANPSLASFSLYGIARDAGSLLVSVDIAVLVACVVGVWYAITRKGIPGSEESAKANRAILSIGIYFFAFLAFIVLAYITHKQPIIFPRYGLTMFALGIPVLPWVYLHITRRHKHWTRKLLITIVAVCVFEASVQLVGSIGFINKVQTFGIVSNYLRSNFQPSRDARVFSDEGTVIALSGLPEANFLTSLDAPHDREGFMAFLREKNVEYLVFVEKEDSIPAKLFPELKDGSGNETFSPVMHAGARFLPTNVWLYRVQD